MNIKSVLNLLLDQQSILLPEFPSWNLNNYSPEELEEKIPDFIFSPNADALTDDLRQKYPRAHIIIPGPVEDLERFVHGNGRAVINENLVQLPIHRILFQRYFTKHSSKNLEQAFGDLFQKVNHCKISGHNVIGYYMDQLAASLIGGPFNVVGFRTYFLHLMTFFNYLRQGKIGGFPISVEMGIGTDEVIVQCEMSVVNFQLEYILEALKDRKVMGTTQGLLKECYQNCDLLDIYYLEKKSSLVVTGVWKKSGPAWQPAKFSSLLLQNIYQFEYQKERIEKMLTAPLIFLQNLEKNIPWEQQILPGDVIMNQLSLHPSVLMQLINFIIEKRSQDERPKLLAELEVIDIERYLMDYPEQAIVELLSYDDKVFILKCLLNQEHLSKLNNLMELAQAEVVITGEQDQAKNTIVKAITELRPTVITTVAGDNLSSDQYKVVIKGETITEDDWIDRRSKFAQSVSTFLNDPNQLLDNVEFLKQQVQKFAELDLNVDETQSLEIVEKLWDETIREQVDHHVVQQLNNELLAQAESKKIGGDLNLLKELELKTEQLENLQKLVNTLKIELGAMKNIKSLQEVEGDSKVILMKMGRQLEMKEKLIGHLKEVQTDLTREKDKKINQLEEKTRQYFRELQRTNAGNEAKMELDKLKKDRDNLNKIIVIKDEIIKKLHTDNKKIEAIQKLSGIGNNQTGSSGFAPDLRELNERKVQVGKLQEELNQMQDKNKISNFKIKQLEGQIAGFQKLLEKKKSSSDLSGETEVAKAIEGKYQLKIKTLEKLNEKLTEEQKKAGKLVADSKKDALKYRADLNTANNRIKDLERKLGIK